jgi:hypothetical protein
MSHCNWAVRRIGKWKCGNGTGSEGATFERFFEIPLFDTPNPNLFRYPPLQKEKNVNETNDVTSPLESMSYQQEFLTLFGKLSQIKKEHHGLLDRENGINTLLELILNRIDDVVGLGRKNKNLFPLRERRMCELEDLVAAHEKRISKLESE